LALNWPGVKTEECMVWNKQDASGQDYKEVISGRPNELHYQACAGGRPCAYPPVAFSFPGPMVFWPLYMNVHTILHPRGVIYRVDYNCTGGGCPWSYDPGDHSIGAEYQGRYDIIGDRSFRWYRLRQNPATNETYTAYFAVPDHATGAICKTDKAKKP